MREQRNETIERGTEKKRGREERKERETEKKEEEYWTFSTEWSLKKS